MSDVIVRLRQFIDKQGISERKFYIETKLPESSFNKIKSVGSENLKKIFHRYPELNMDWVVTGRGEMIVKEVATNGACSTCLEWERKFNSEVQKNRDLLEEIRALEKSKQKAA